MSRGCNQRKLKIIQIAKLKNISLHKNAVIHYKDQYYNIMYDKT